MKKFTNGIHTLPIAAGFMLMPSFFWAQTTQQVQSIREESDLKTLSTLSKKLKNSPSELRKLERQAEKMGMEFSGETENGLFQLHSFDKNTGLPFYYTTYNVDAAVGTATNKINSTDGIFNLDGENMKVHEWDGGGTRTSHQEFGGRAVQKDKPSKSTDHATHVAGTMIASGVNSKAKGMAPKAQLDTYDWTNDAAEMAEAAQQGALVSNHSYGLAAGFQKSGSTQPWQWYGADEDTEYRYYGKYTEKDQQWDLIALNAPHYLIVKAAGNDRGSGPEPGTPHLVRIWDPNTNKFEWKASKKTRQKNGGEFGFDTLTHGALGKNILVVGAAEKIKGEYKTPADVKMASFSNFGPVDDGRIKPDIAGIGVGIYSSTSSNNTSYTSMDGTSMASPNVTGSLLLLQEHYSKLNGGNFMKAATLKALTIGTANEAGDAAGPDYKSGWGLLNAYKAAISISTKGQYALIEEKSLANNATDRISVKAAGTEPLVITIAWTDPAPKELPSYDMNDRKATLINDLDVRVLYNGQTFLPWKLDPANPNNPATQGDNIVDNVEQIVIQNPVAGATYEIEISHKNQLRKNEINTVGSDLVVDLVDATEQNYSIVVTGINENISQDLALKSIAVQVPEAQYSIQTPVAFEIENKGNASFAGGKLKYQLINTDNNSVEFTGEVNLADIAAGQSISQVINIDLSKSFVNYKIVGEIVATDDQIEINNKQDISTYGYMVDLTQRHSFHFFGFEEDFNKNGWTSEDIDQDKRTWRRYGVPTFARTGEAAAVNFPNNKKGTHDWFFSNPLKMKGGGRYRISFSTYKPKDGQEKIDVFFGTSANSGAMLNPIKENVEATKEYIRHTYTFTPNADGIHYIGFRNQMPDDAASYAVFIDDVRIDFSDKPIVDFKASTKTANAFTPITFTDDTYVEDANDPNLSHEWSFSPNTITYAEGSATSKNPKVIFNNEGLYTVSLKVKDSRNEETETKNEYITIKNTPARARFFTTRTELFEGQRIGIDNTSSGDPKPTEYLWSVIPSEGVEFVEGTSNTSAEPLIKFKNAGNYTITLKAKSLAGEDNWERADYITVKPARNPVKNLKAVADAETHEVKLQWHRPNLAPTYLEDFEGKFNKAKNTNLPAEIKVINSRNDRNTWGLDFNSKSGHRSAANYTWNGVGDDWLIIPKQKKGAEILEYMVVNMRAENHEVYVLEKEDDATPTADDFLQNGQLIYASGDVIHKDWTAKKFNIKKHTTKDFYIAFRHNTTNGLMVNIDDISVGYENDETRRVNSLSPEDKEQIENLKKGIDDETIIASENAYEQNAEDYREFFGYLTDTPTLTGYEIVRNGIVVGNIDQNMEVDVAHTDIVRQNGRYTYTINSVYSDGTKVPQEITINIDNLNDAGLKVYPNPSNGRFVVAAKPSVTSLKAEVYDMAGRLIFSQHYNDYKADIDISGHTKGIYILKITDNRNREISTKLMVQ